MATMSTDFRSSTDNHMTAKISAFLMVFLVVGTTHAIGQRGGIVPSPIRVVAVELHPHGFVPQTIKPPAGPFVLVVYNRTGREGISLELNNALAGLGSAKFADKWAARGIRRTSPLLDLPRGEYVLWEAARPDQRLRVVVDR